MNESIDLHVALRMHFGLEALRPWQEEAVRAVMGEPGRVLVIAPTGGGKSLTYQLPAVLLDGTALVLSPLVALMEDQVRALTARGVSATYLASTLEMGERHAREAALVRGEYKLVYAAPERLASEAFVALLGRAQISLVAVDEAHCIAQWGHDFRPDYLRIGALLERLGPRRVLACTATATPEVRAQIREHLGFQEGACREILRGFARPNLHLSARSVEGPKQARIELLHMIERTLGTGAKLRGTGIVYAATRRSAEEYAARLRDKGFRAEHYHAGEDAETRSRITARFASGETPIIVATNAFGMGIDRPDIRVVVHVQPPASLEAYYQEVGRAGRDGEAAHGLLLCSGLDIATRRRLAELGPDHAPADPAAIARAWRMFRELLRYLDARSCRHDFLLRYFGDEQELLGGCGHCDVCASLDSARASHDDTAETSLVVRKALSGVARAHKRAGLSAIVEMLRGVSSERVRRFRFEELSTFGLLSGMPEDWVLAVLRGILAAGWVDLTPTEHPVPFVTKSGLAVMRGEVPVRFVLPARAPRASAPATPTKSRVAGPIFERLRTCRAELARTEQVPAFVVAHDRMLHELAEKKPRDLVELADVAGFGPQRIARYGMQLLSALQDAPQSVEA